MWSHEESNKDASDRFAANISEMRREYETRLDDKEAEMKRKVGDIQHSQELRS